MRSALVLCVLAATAAADGERPMTIEVGKTVQVDVGYARGWMCDDASLVTAEMVTKNDHNYWVVTGAKVGRTLCRVGTDALAPGYVFDLKVVAAKKR